MSVTSIGSTPSQSQSLGLQLLQQLNAMGTSSVDAGTQTGMLGDMLTVSPAAQQLAQVPDAVTKALSDLLSTQKDTTGDLTQLKAYFQQNPQSLVNVLNSLQSGSTTYGAAGSLGSNSALMTALLNGQSNNSNPSALLGLLSGNQTQDSLFSLLGDSNSESDNSALSILG